MIEEYRAGYQDAINDVCRMFDAEHEIYQQLWKTEGTAEEMHRSEIRLSAINSVICTLTSNLSAGIR